MPLSIQYMAVIIVALMAYTLVFIMMLSGGDRGRSNPEMNVGGIPFTMDQIGVDVNSMEEHNKFLRSGNPSLLRIKQHRPLCTSFSNGVCNCNRGTYTFSEINDVEAQLLRPGNAGGTSVGLENFSRVFNTPNNATDSLDAALSVGTVVPGESWGTGNQFF